MARPTIRRNGVPLTAAERQQRARAKRQEIKHDRAACAELEELHRLDRARRQAILDEANNLDVSHITGRPHRKGTLTIDGW